MRPSQSLIGLLLLALVPLAGCRSHRPPPPAPVGVHPAPPTSLDDALRMIDRRDDWSARPPVQVPRNPAEKYLAGLVIVLDPGHGGSDHNGRGRAGVLEADMNWRVAVLLRRLLEDAGVHVTLTRNGDEFVELRQRAEIANNVPRPDGGKGADLFISLHHNSTQSRTTNWSSVWYHGQVDDEETSLDAVRPVALALGRALRTQVGVTSPLFSDQLMYNSGFAVLRHSRVPCFLCESSFYSNPEEEQRLADAAYNLREAYAIYTGLCNWAYCGRPTQSAPKIEGSGGTVHLTTTLNDGLPPWWGKERNRIFRSSIQVLVNGKPAESTFDEKTRELNASVNLGTSESPVIEVHFANMFGNHNWPQRYRLHRQTSGGESQAITLEPLGENRPAATSRPSTRPSARPSTAR